MGAVTELCYERDGIGELSLLLPALAQLSAQKRWVMFVGAPYPLYAPALARAGVDLYRMAIVTPTQTRQIAWAAEQALHSGACGGVVTWLRQIDDRGLRRLQLAAEAGRGFCALLRPLAAATQASPAALRLRLDAQHRLTISKCRGRVGRAAPPAIDLGAHAHAVAGA
jgi:cell division inhibitor SulA